MNTLTFTQYQLKAASTAIYPPKNALPYLSLGLTAEAGEVADKVAKYYRGDKELNPVALAKELGDVLWFVSQLSGVLGFSLEQVATMNMNKLQTRQLNNTLQGDGDNR